MKRLVLLGANGAMGAEAARHLTGLAGLDVVLAGFAGAPYQVDILDTTRLHELLADADIVVNCAGPFFRLGVPALRAAIATRTTYVDICDDPDPTVDMLALDAEARAAGVGALVGMGASPGLSNLLAMRAARELDRVIDCYTAWPLDVAAPGQDGSSMDDGRTPDGAPTAAAVHLMEQISGTVRVVERGAVVRRDPLRAVELTYPGSGAGHAYVVGHPEPITLSRSLGVGGDAANVMLVTRPTVQLLRSVQRDIDGGALSLEAAAGIVVDPPKSRVARAVLTAAAVKGHGSLPPFFALLRGTRDGREVVVGCQLHATPPGMAAATAIPAVLAVRQLLERPMAPGVHPPEAVVDADRLLADLASFTSMPHASLDALAPVSAAPTGR
jgi:lysine 6-dehydrogenase